MVEGVEGGKVVEGGDGREERGRGWWNVRVEVGEV